MNAIKQQLQQQWQQVKDQAAANPRLRVSLWAIAALLLAYPLLILSDYHDELSRELERELQREAKIIRTASEEQWLTRAEGTQTVYEKLQARLWQAPSTGIAKATLQQTLNEWSQQYALKRFQVRLEEPVLVQGYDSLYRISGQIDAEFAVASNMDFVKELETYEKDIVIEQMQVSQRARPIHKLVIAAYFDVRTEN